MKSDGDAMSAEVWAAIENTARIVDIERLRSVVCSLTRHSRIAMCFFGYQYCGRCGAQIGDTLGSIGANVVTTGHLRSGECEECNRLRPLLTWLDWYLLQDEALDGEAEAGREA